MPYFLRLMPSLIALCVPWTMNAEMYAQSLWQALPEPEVAAMDLSQETPPGRVLQLNRAWMRTRLEESSPGVPVDISLPLPDGSDTFVQVIPAEIMEKPLAQRYPNFRVYRVYGPDVLGGCLDMTPLGFHAMLLTKEGTVLINPLSEQSTPLVQSDPLIMLSSYRADHFQIKPPSFICRFDTLGEQQHDRDRPGFQMIPFIADPLGVPIEGELLTYRTAIACTGEYAQFHGGTVEHALAAIVTALNRVNLIYERDLALRMLLVAENDRIIFLDSSTDPYTNDSGISMLSQNQSTIDSIIGDDHYDIGHVFSTGGGGIASLGVPCVGNFKARGVTGLSSPTGDPFHVDYVAHEIGHQFGANHTFNGIDGSCGGNRFSPTAYEPGSGSTIMAYAGICNSDNLQQNSDDFFHIASVMEMYTYTRFLSGNSCVSIEEVTNHAPTVDAGVDYTIPGQTPFQLTGTAHDQDDGDQLTYSWEQFDAGSSSPVNVDSGNNAILRAYLPMTIPVRVFPRLEELLTGKTIIGEHLPTTDRDLTFKLVVRDNHPAAGGLAYDEITLQVISSAGPFQVTSPNGVVDTWTGGEDGEIQWSVAATDNPPISCTEIDIDLSLDDGVTFPLSLAASVPNTGSFLAIVPNEPTTIARIRVSCRNNIFFDVSDHPFTIEAVARVCTRRFTDWSLMTGSDFVDTNDNGIIDIADLIFCLFEESIQRSGK